MSKNNPEINNQNSNLDSDDATKTERINDLKLIDQNKSMNDSPKWINNRGEEVTEVFGFNENAELVNARLAMIGFLMLILTELAFSGKPATQAIFGIN